LPPAPRMMSTGQRSSSLLCSTSTTSPGDHPPNCIRQPEGDEAPSLDDDEELQEAGPQRDEGSQHLRRQAARSRDHSSRRGCHLL
jgi:hypothetical protein